MKQQFLLIEDLEPTGRKGDIVTVRSGFARNYLLPKKLAVVATVLTVKLREKLQAEREKQAASDRKSSEELAAKLKELALSTTVKTDSEGRFYGSVSALDIVHLLEKAGVTIERRHVLLPAPLRSVGKHDVRLRLKEGVIAKCTIEVTAEVE